MKGWEVRRNKQSKLKAWLVMEEDTQEGCKSKHGLRIVLLMDGVRRGLKGKNKLSSMELMRNLVRCLQIGLKPSLE